MTYITLLRHTHWNTGTYGEMAVGDKIIYTAERPWLNNEPFKSCIPEGSYEVVRHRSPKFGECFSIVGDGVTIDEASGGKRYGILFHAANWPDQVQGCIAPGLFFQPINVGGRDWPQSVGVGRSNQAMQYMLATLPDVWHLQITHAESGC